MGFDGCRMESLKKVRVSGGPLPRSPPWSRPASGRRAGGRMAPSSLLLAGGGTGLFGVSAAGGEPEVLTARLTVVTTSGPKCFPTGEAVLFHGCADFSAREHPDLHGARPGNR